MIRIRKCHDCPDVRYRVEKGYNWWCRKESKPIYHVHGKIPYWCRLPDAPQEHKRFAEGFKAGQLAVKRRNQSGCCCIIDDNDEVITPCAAHLNWRDALIKNGTPEDKN